MKNEIQKLLQKDMDRRDFLKHVGIGFIAIAGFTTVIKTLTTLNNSPKDIATTGYGSSVYGGSAVPNTANTLHRKVQG